MASPLYAASTPGWRYQPHGFINIHQPDGNVRRGLSRIQLDRVHATLRIQHFQQRQGAGSVLPPGQLCRTSRRVGCLRQLLLAKLTLRVQHQSSLGFLQGRPGGLLIGQVGLLLNGVCGVYGGPYASDANFSGEA